MGLNWDLKDMEAAMVKPCQRVASHGSEGQRALEFIHSFAVSNLQKSENTVGTLIIYRNEVCGQFDTDGISLTTAAAKRILTDNRFEPDAILKEWLEKGWLDTYSGRQFEKQKTLNGKKTWCVCLNNKALQSLGLNEQEHEEPDLPPIDAGVIPF